MKRVYSILFFIILCAVLVCVIWGKQIQVTANNPPIDIFHMLVSHEAKARHEEFQAATHRCDVCFEFRLGRNGICPPCGHWHCHSCMENLAAVCIQHSDPDGICCPQHGCRAPLPPDVVQQLLSPDQLLRWDELLLQKTLRSMRDVVFCPRCNVAAVESEDLAQCPGCGFAFCSLCCQAYHPGEQCATPDQRLKVLEMRMQRCWRDGQVRLL